MTPPRALVLVLVSALSSLGGLASLASASAPPLRASESPVKVGSALVISEQDGAEEQVTGHLALHGGSVVEPTERKGAATLLARLLVTDELRSWLEGRGGSIESSVDLDAIRFDFTCASADLEGTLERLNSALRSSEYETAPVAAARAKLIAELEQRESSIPGIADRAADRLLYGRFDDYLPTPPLEHVRALTAADLSAYHKANIGANRVVCAIVSSLAKDKVEAAVAKGLEGLGDVAPAPADPARPLYVSPITKIYVVDVPNADHSELRILSPGQTRQADIQPALELYNFLAAAGPESRVQKEVVESGLATSATVEFDSGWNRMGAFRASVSGTHENIAEALQSIMIVLQDHRSGTVTEAEMDAGHLNYSKWNEEQLADPAVRARRMAQTTLYGYPANYYETSAALAQACRRNYLVGALRQNLLIRSLIMVAVGPAEQITENLQYYTDTIEFTFDTPASEPEAAAQVARMFEALGGRKLWAELEGAAVKAEIEVEQSDEWRTRKANVWRYFETVHTRVEQSTLREEVYVTDGTPGWTLSNLGLRNTSNSRYRMDVLNTRHWLYNLLHELALEDSPIVASLDEQGRLVFTDPLGEICWMELGENGRPARSGYTDLGGEHEVIYKTWSKSGDYLYCNEFLIPYTQLGVSAEYPQRVKSFVPNPPLDPELFDRPAE